MRGVPGVSKDIFKHMKSLKPAEEVESRPSTVQEGGAAASLAKRNAPVREINDDVVNMVMSKSGFSNTPIVTTKRTRISEQAVKGRTDFSLSLSDFCLDLIRIAGETGDYSKIMHNLYMMYVGGTLDDYDINGLDKNQIFGYIDDFKDTLSRVLK